MYIEECWEKCPPDHYSCFFALKWSSVKVISGLSPSFIHSGGVNSFGKTEEKAGHAQLSNILISLQKSECLYKVSIVSLSLANKRPYLVREGWSGPAPSISKQIHLILMFSKQTHFALKLSLHFQSAFYQYKSGSGISPSICFHILFHNSIRTLDREGSCYLIHFFKTLTIYTYNIAFLFFWIKQLLFNYSSLHDTKHN